MEQVDPGTIATWTATPTPTLTPKPTPTLKPDTATLGEKNAAAKALSYLRYSAFSREGLIDQLEFEGFSHTEAVYGADQSGADWYEQAAKKAEQYLKYSSFSRSGLIDQLEFEGFTRSQAEYGVKAVGY
jgi:SOS response regulatory protein OraA/RecX